MSNAASSTIEVKCPQCGTVLNVPSQFAGKKGRCSSCQNVFVITPVTAAPAASPSFAQPPLPPVRSAPESGPAPAGNFPGSPFDDDDFKLSPLPTPATQLNPYTPPPNSPAAYLPSNNPYGSGNRASDGDENGWKMIGGGAAAMVGAVVWFFVALIYFDRIFFYPPILFIMGLVGCIRGLIKLGSS